MQLRYPDNVLNTMLHYEACNSKLNYSIAMYDAMVEVAKKAPELILERGINLGNNVMGPSGNDALGFAARNYDLMFREFLNILGKDQLAEACNRVLYDDDRSLPSASVVRLLLQGGAEVNRVNSSGQTLLIKSLMYQSAWDFDLTKTLLECKADPNFPSKTHGTPLQCVLNATRLTTNQLKRIIHALLEAGATV